MTEPVSQLAASLPQTLPVRAQVREAAPDAGAGELEMEGSFEGVVGMLGRHRVCSGLCCAEFRQVQAERQGRKLHGMLLPACDPC